MRSTFLALALVSALGVDVQAQEATEAQLLFERGAELYRARRFGEALEAMVASNRLVPNANVVFNVAQIYELLDRPIDAFNWYQRHLTLVSDADGRARTVGHVTALLPRVAVVAVETRPSGAELYVDRIELGSVGRSPLEIAVQPGERAVIARIEGYGDARSPATVATGDRAPLSLVLERMLGRLELVSEPAGARVFSEGTAEALGTTPLVVQLPVGLAKLVLRSDGYLEQRVELHVGTGEPTPHSVRLVRDPARFARLSITASPVGATVRLDGRTAGTAPLLLEGLAPGTRQLEVVRTEHEPWSTTLPLTAGSTTHARITLLADDDKPWPYWRWVGYGAAGTLFAAGAILGVVAVSKNQKPGSASSVEDLNHAADGLMGTGLVLGAITAIWDLTRDAPPHSSGEVRVGP